STRPVGRRGLFLGAGGVLAAGLLAACAEEVEPPPAPSTGKELAEPTPAQTTEQITAIVPEANAAVSAADADLDSEELSPRLRGRLPHRGLRDDREGRGVGRGAPCPRRGAPGAPDLGERRVPAGRDRAGRGLPGGGGALLRGAPAGGREVPLHHLGLGPAGR